MQHGRPSEAEVRQTLEEAAKRLFGADRTAELTADLDQTARELTPILHQPLSFEDEP